MDHIKPPLLTPSPGRPKQDQGSESCQDTRQQWEHHTQGDGTPSSASLGPARPQGGGHKNWGRSFGEKLQEGAKSWC